MEEKEKVGSTDLGAESKIKHLDDYSIWYLEAKKTLVEDELAKLIAERKFMEAYGKLKGASDALNRAATIVYAMYIKDAKDVKDLAELKKAVAQANQAKELKDTKDDQGKKEDDTAKD